MSDGKSAVRKVLLSFPGAMFRGLSVAFLFFVPPYLMGAGIEHYLHDRPVGSFLNVTPQYPISLFMGTAVLLLVYIVVSIDFYKMYLNKSVDAESLAGFPDKMLYLAVGLFMATTLGLIFLSQWESSLKLYRGGGASSLAILLFVLDNMLKGILVDVFEVYDFSVSYYLKHDSSNWLFCAYLVFFRFMTSALFLAFVILKYREIKNPNWHVEYREGQKADE